MKKYQELRIQAELWEIQFWLVLLLALALEYIGHSILSKCLLGYAAFTLIGTVSKLAHVSLLEKQDTN